MSVKPRASAGSGGQRGSGMRKCPVILFLATLALTSASAQKVKVVYDKNVDFSKYKSFTVPEPGATPTRPILYASLVGVIKETLAAKGLTSAEKDGDLTVMPRGGVGYDLSSAPKPDNSCPNCKAPARDVEWPAYMAPPGGGGQGLPKGTLELDIVDRATNKVVWAGAVSQKLDPEEKRSETLQKIYKAVNKLLLQYPPQKK